MKKRPLTPKQREVLGRLNTSGRWSGTLYAERFYDGSWQALDRRTVRCLIGRGMLRIEKSGPFASGGALVPTEAGRAAMTETIVTK